MLQASNTLVLELFLRLLKKNHDKFKQILDIKAL